MKIADMLRTIRSLQRQGKSLWWTLDYRADYRLEAFLRRGARNERDLLRFLKETFLPYVPLPMPRVPDFGCSTFVARTPEGHVLFGRNFDLNQFAPPITVRTRPAGAFASVSTTGAEFLGFSERHLPSCRSLRSLALLGAPYVPVDGMNERGFAVAVLLVPGEKPVHQETGKTPITTTTAVRLLLDRASDVSSALALLDSFDMHHAIGSAFHLHLADATGASAIVEYGTDGAARVVHPTPPATSRAFAFQCCTNFHVDAPPSEPSPRLGTDRYELLTRRLTESGGVLPSAEAALGLLDAVAHPRTEWGTGDLTAGTQWSVVFDLTARRSFFRPKCTLAGARRDNLIECLGPRAYLDRLEGFL